METIKLILKYLANSTARRYDIRRNSTGWRQCQHCFRGEIAPGKDENTSFYFYISSNGNPSRRAIITVPGIIRSSWTVPWKATPIMTIISIIWVVRNRYCFSTISIAQWPMKGSAFRRSSIMLLCRRIKLCPMPIRTLIKAIHTGIYRNMILKMCLISSIVIGATTMITIQPLYWRMKVELFGSDW